LTLTATWKPIEYEVSFYADGTLVSTQTYTIENKNITVPKIPEKANYKSAWSSYTLTTGDVRVDAIYTPITYTATYIVDGETYDTVSYNVEDDENSFPSPPQKVGYTVEWDKKVEYGNVTVYAVYTPITYCNTYVLSDAQVERVYYTVESVQTYEPTVPTLSGYDGEWEIIEDDSVYEGVENETIYHASYSIKTYTASFYINDTCVKCCEYDVFTEKLDEPQIPDKDGYSKAWVEYTLDCNDLKINAVYTPIVYTATFVADGKVVEEIEFTVENMGIVAPEVPQRVGYSCKWEEYTLTLSDIQISAEYQIIDYTINFVVDGSVIESQTFNVLTECVKEPEIPTKKGYNADWEDYILECKNIDVNAIFTPNFDFDNLTYELSQDGSYYTVTGYTGNEKDIVIPSEHDGVPVKVIGEYAFFSTEIESIYLNFGIEKIEKNAFSYCTKLLDITLCDSLTTIEEYAFEYGRFTNITLPNSLEHLEKYAFKYCENLTEITLPTSLKVVGYRAFYNCTSLRFVTFSDGVEEIGEESFYECINIEKIDFGNTVTTIDRGAFYIEQDRGTYSLKELYIPKNIKIIGVHAFENRVNIANVTFEVTEGWNLAQSTQSPYVLRIDSYELRDSQTSAKTFYKHTDLYWINS
jgi:hypothetical protein